MKASSRKAVVTGASSGIGEALSRRLARDGYEVWLTARREDRLQALAEDIVESGGRAHACAVDVSDFEATCTRMLAIDEGAGGIDLVVANAGMAGARAAVPLAGNDTQQAKAILIVNVLGALATLMPFIPRMRERGRGHLVGVTSLVVDAPNPRAAHYGASKAALRHFLRCADIELRPFGVLVTEVVPGWVNTPAVEAVEEPMPMIWEMDRAADYIAKGIRRGRRQIRFPWALQTLARSSHAVMPRAIYDPMIRRMAKTSPDS